MTIDQNPETDSVYSSEILRLMKIVKEPTEEEILELAQVFFSSTTLSRGIKWGDLVREHPAKVIFFTGGVARVLMYLKEEILKGGRKTEDSDVPSSEEDNGKIDGCTGTMGIQS